MTSGTSLIPQSVLDAYEFTGKTIRPVAGGLINQTYVVLNEFDQPTFALQSLHPVFSAKVNLDLEAVAAYASQRGLQMPVLLRTTDGAAWCESAGDIWRVTSWVQGRCYAKVPSPQLAEAAAELAGRFHHAVADMPYRFLAARIGVHDTAMHLTRLRDAMADASEVEAVALAEEILAAAATCPTLAQDLPKRICHGDLKISNLVFAEDGSGRSLVDLDTLGRQTIAYEMGDALRSWGNRGGEDVAEPCIDPEIVTAAARGYARGTAGILSTDEIDSVISGLEIVCNELAARFCVDIFDDSYFGWDPKRFASRKEHNMLRARGQLSLGASVARQRDELRQLWRREFGL